MKTVKIPDETHQKLLTYKALYYKAYGQNLTIYQIIDLLVDIPKERPGEYHFDDK